MKREQGLRLGLSMAVRVLGAGASLLLTVWLAKVMPSEDAGRFFWAMNVALGLSFICKWGTDIVLMRIMSIHDKNNAKAKQLVKMGLKLVARIAIIVASVGMVAAFVLGEKLLPDNEYFDAYMLALCGLLPLSLAGPICGVLRGLDKQSMAGIVEKAGQPALLLLVVTGLAATGMATTKTVLVANVLVLVAITILGYKSVVKPHAGEVPCEEARYERKNDDKLWGEIITSGMALTINNIAGFIVNWGGGVVLAWYVTASDVAVFAGAQRLSNAISIVFAVFSSSYAVQMPRLIAEGKKDELEKLILRGTRNMMLVSLPVLIPMLFVPSIIMKMMGEAYIGGGAYLAWLAGGQVLTMATGFAGSLLAMAGKERLLRNVGVAVAMIMVVTNILIIPRYGATGAAIVTVLGMAIQGGAFVCMVERYMGVKYLRPN